MGGATELKSTSFLKIFALEKQLGPDPLIDGGACQDRSPVDVGENVLVSLKDGFKVGGLVHPMPV